MKFSIITPTLNRGRTIRDAIESVLVQGITDLEHIVVDGGSHDETLDIIKEYPHLKVVSEPDRGLYDAINKGIRLSSGEIICHLNADDLLSPGALSAVLPSFQTNPKLESVAGGAEVFVRSPYGKESIIYRLNAAGIKQLRLGDITHGTTIINSRFFRRSLYDRLGLYDLRFPIAADRAFLMRAYLGSMHRTIVSSVVYRYRSHPQSLTLREGSIINALKDNVAAAFAGISENKIPGKERSSYQRWYAWSVLYLLKDQVKLGEMRSAANTLVKALRAEPTWPLRSIPELIDHWKTRQERRWADS